MRGFLINFIVALLLLSASGAKGSRARMLIPVCKAGYTYACNTSVHKKPVSYSRKIRTVYKGVVLKKKKNRFTITALPEIPVQFAMHCPARPGPVLVEDHHRLGNLFGQHFLRGPPSIF